MREMVSYVFLRRREFAIGLALLAAVAVGLLARPMGAFSPSNPVTMGATIVSQDADTIVLRVTGPEAPGKLSGSTINTRVTADTRFVGLRRSDRIGPDVPLIATIDMQLNSDGTYTLLSLAAQTR
jgi:hypothetical protein